MTRVLPETRTLSLLEKVAVFSQKRQEVLAGNIANVSTPGYRTRDLPVDAFQEALRKAIELKQPKSRSLADEVFPNLPGVENVEGIFKSELFDAIERKPGDLTFQDSANRSVETEVMEMTKNSLTQAAAIELLTAQFRMTEAVITGRA